MIRKLVALLVLSSFLTVAVYGQEPDPKAIEEVEEAVTELKDAIKGKVTSDCIHFAKVLGSKWKHAIPKQRKAAFALLKKNLKSKERDVREATIVVLGRTGGGKKDKDAKAATKILLGETSQKRTKEDLDMFAKCLVSVGRLRTADGAKALVKLLRHKDNEIIAGSLEGMTHFRDATFPIRKDLVGEVIKTYTSIFGQWSADPSNATVKKKLRATENQAEAALAAMTKKTDVKGANSWRKWWNKEGKRSKKW